MSRGLFGGVWDEDVEIKVNGEEGDSSKSEKDDGTVLVFGTDICCDKRTDRENDSSSKIEEVNGMILGFSIAMDCDSSPANICLKGNGLADNSTSSYNSPVNLRKKIERL